MDSGTSTEKEDNGMMDANDTSYQDHTSSNGVSSLTQTIGQILDLNDKTITNTLLKENATVDLVKQQYEEREKQLEEEAIRMGRRNAFGKLINLLILLCFPFSPPPLPQNSKLTKIRNV